ncbi:MAG: TetR/AcrR family transcriptional regulator [Pseudomonadales bacterium]|nr:TetR/AcrR family transcriptional regulator [Pseudomonadales bacterium]
MSSESEQSKAADTPTRILEATVRILEAEGGKGVRMSDIARETGISRQALYLHFASRTELLTAATRWVDEQLGLEERLAPSRHARSGEERLALYIELWGNYIPDVYGVAKALMLAEAGDEAAASAWRDRMLAMKDGCRAIVEMLAAEGRLSPLLAVQPAIDSLWTLMLVPNWEHLTQVCGWSREEYIERITLIARQMLLSPADQV